MRSARPEDIEGLKNVIDNIISASREVAFYPRSISAGMRLDEACEVWLRARGKLQTREEEAPHV